MEGQGIETFVPMHYVDTEVGNGVKRTLKPVVSNLIFVKKVMSENEMRRLVYEAPYKMMVYRRNTTDRAFCEISAREMHEFRLMCNPEIELRKYVSEAEAQMKPGAPVLVKYGPLKGLTGRLVRSDKKYYLLKEVPGIGVMLKVSRWCCIPLE